MTDGGPYMVEPDCPACDDGLVDIVWPPDNPDTLDVTCYFCETDVVVARKGTVELTD